MSSSDYLRFTSDEIIRLLEEPTEHRYPIKKRITEEAPGLEVVKALQQATDPLTRQILCYIAGDRYERDAVPTLIPLLSDPYEGVRASAADALGTIGDVRAGPALLELFADRERTGTVPDMVASALGAVGYRPAIPLLIQALEDDNYIIRGLAAWALGTMGATEAAEAVRAALARETEPPGYYVRERLIETLEALELANTAMTAMRREDAIPVLLAALKHRPLVGVLVTSAAWALGNLKAKEAVKPLERLLARYPKGLLAEHLQAALNEIRSNKG